MCRALALALALVAASPFRAAEPAPPGDCVAVPFAQQVDVRTVAALAHEAPERLLERIDRLGIDLRRVPGGVPGRPVNPLLATLPVADPRLLGLAEFRDGYEGRSIPRAVLAGGPARDTVLIRETASTWTLLHEVVHLLIVPSDGFVPRADLELRFSLAFHRLQVYQRRLYDDPWRLLDPRWRRDIVDAQQEVATLLYDRLRIGQSQEAIVERVLEGCIDARSPYFDAARRDEGRRYGTAMIDNAIDVFDTLNASVEHTDATVRQSDRWGDYAAAIARAERATGRTAPNPTEPTPKGGRRLSPRFVEWMMMLPAGHVTDVPGLTRNDQLKALGNGVVPPCDQGEAGDRIGRAVMQRERQPPPAAGRDQHQSQR